MLSIAGNFEGIVRRQITVVDSSQHESSSMLRGRFGAFGVGAYFFRGSERA